MPACATARLHTNRHRLEEKREMYEASLLAVIAYNVGQSKRTLHALACNVQCVLVMDTCKGTSVLTSDGV